ncbi:hypothetical protein SDC9_79759 [bioreactor metagenome]|uniref:Uncharacterized protein n=1 Tax=bioreactor metagenome TaxID=1076179 RepID=A0A644YX51_9ZZZZ
MCARMAREATFKNIIVSFGPFKGYAPFFETTHGTGRACRDYRGQPAVRHFTPSRHYVVIVTLCVPRHAGVAGVVTRHLGHRICCGARLSRRSFACNEHGNSAVGGFDRCTATGSSCSYDKYVRRNLHRSPPSLSRIISQIPVCVYV